MDYVQLGSSLIDTELIQNFLHEVSCFKAGIGDQRQIITFVGEMLDQGTTQQGFPAANLPCQHNGPFPRLYPVKEALESLLMPCGRKIETGVWNVFEGSLF